MPPRRFDVCLTYPEGGIWTPPPRFGAGHRRHGGRVTGMNVRWLRGRVPGGPGLLLVPAAALVVHQLRYTLAYGSSANAELAATGPLVPPLAGARGLVLALGIGLSAFVRRAATRCEPVRPGGSAGRRRRPLGATTVPGSSRSTRFRSRSKSSSPRATRPVSPGSSGTAAGGPCPQRCSSQPWSSASSASAARFCARSLRAHARHRASGSRGLPVPATVVLIAGASARARCSRPRTSPLARAGFGRHRAVAAECSTRRQVVRPCGRRLSMRRRYVVLFLAGLGLAAPASASAHARARRSLSTTGSSSTAAGGGCRACPSRFSTATARFASTSSADRWSCAATSASRCSVSETAPGRTAPRPRPRPSSSYRPGRAGRASRPARRSPGTNTGSRLRPMTEGAQARSRRFAIPAVLNGKPVEIGGTFVRYARPPVWPWAAAAVASAAALASRFECVPGCALEVDRPRSARLAGLAALGTLVAFGAADAPNGRVAWAQIVIGALLGVRRLRALLAPSRCVRGCTWRDSSASRRCS